MITPFLQLRQWGHHEASFRCLGYPAMNGKNHDEHGNRCSCRLLAEAVGCNPKTIRFTYCQAVLMKHWDIECNHGCRDVPMESRRSFNLHGVGPIDPIKAVLIKNKNK